MFIQRKFFTFLTITLFLFTCISLTLVAGSLYGIVTNTMAHEYYNDLRFKQAETGRNLENRFKEIEARVNQMGLNNAIRINLMLGIKNKLNELINQQFAFLNGAFFVIHEPENDNFIPNLPDNFKYLKPYLKQFAREDQKQSIRFRDFGNNVFYSLFSVPIQKHTQRLGTAFVIYNLALDSVFWSNFEADLDIDLLFQTGSDLISIKNNHCFKMPSTYMPDHFYAVNGIHLTELSSGKYIMPVKEFPGLFFSVSSHSLHNKTNKLITQFAGICFIIFGLTFLVSLLIAHKVSKPLENMAKQAMNIAKDPSNINLIKDKTGHDEFAILASAFNELLTSLRKAKQELEKKSLKELKASEQLYLSTENAVRKSKARKQAILKAMPDCLFICDKSGVFIDYHAINPEDLYLPPDRFLHKRISDILPKSLSSKFMDSINKTLQTGEIQTFEYELNKRKGLFYYEARIIISDIDDIIIIVRDITNRKKAHKALQESQRFNERITETTPDIIYVYDIINYNFIYINRRIYDATGYLSEEVINMGTNFDKLFCPNDLLKRDERILQWSTAKDNDIFIYEYKVKAKDGQWQWMQTHNTVFQRNSKGKVSQILGTARNITKRKYMERELIFAKEAAENANIAKSEFLARMSHELRTPLNAIIGMKHLLIQTGLNLKQKNYLDKITISADELLGLINDILDFSKLESKKLTIKITEFDLEKLIDGLSDTFNPKCKAKGLEILFIVAVDVPYYLLGDSVRLEQILHNLINNAIKFTNSGKIIVSVEVLNSNISLDKNKIRLLFTVQDTGIGIPEENIKDLFNPFTQADGSITRKFGGTGLGLSICKQLVEMMGGAIWVQSIVNKGSIFKFAAEFSLQPEIRKKCFFSDNSNYKIEKNNQKLCPEKLKPIDFEKLEPLFNDLAGFIEDGDSESEECLRNIIRYLDGRGPVEHIIQLENEIANFDFEKAQKTLSKIVQIFRNQHFS